MSDKLAELKERAETLARRASDLAQLDVGLTFGRTGSSMTQDAIMAVQGIASDCSNLLMEMFEALQLEEPCGWCKGAGHIQYDGPCNGCKGSGRVLTDAGREHIDMIRRWIM